MVRVLKDKLSEWAGRGLSICKGEDLIVNSRNHGGGGGNNTSHRTAKLAVAVRKNSGDIYGEK